MDLILWRHAEAEEGFDDLSRKLTARGHRQAEKMAKWLTRQLRGRNVQLIASEARRSQQTLAAFSKDFLVDPRLNPGASAAAYFSSCGWPSSWDGVVVVAGHQPEIGRVASLALTGREVEWAIKKGAIWWLQQRIGPGGPQVKLRAMVTPQML
ncbi:MAG: histidine phosphatase family protein [Formivibrio sp.]|nr:histidine phosphatase family protein [Formivibrio sp.]